MKKLYIFTFSGASSLGAALALPSDGKVVACDVSEEFTREGQKRWKEAGVAHKVDLRIAPAQETLQKLIDGGEVGQYHGVPKGVNLQKKLPGSDTYFFEKYIPLGIQKRPNENIRCVA